ncbi:sterol desaturase family protein [bacterium]|nr:sterol desaturase family protein [bacterium]
MINPNMNDQAYDLQKLNVYIPAVAFVLSLLSYALHRVKQTPNPMTVKETLCNYIDFVVWRLVFFAGGAAILFWLLSWANNVVPWSIPVNWMSFIALLVLVDFAYYWKHRKEHEWSVLWCQHHVHHSSQEYNLSTSLRLPWLGSYFTPPFFLPLAFLGFDALMIISTYQILLAYQYLVHTEMVGKLGPLENILNTPSRHRVHHGRNEKYLDKNYGGILIVWDKIFGTLAEETTPVEYGTVKLIKTVNPIKVNVLPWIDLWGHLKRRKGITAKAKALFLSPSEIEQ